MRSDGYPLVSVVITSFNYEAFVGGAVRSVLAQEYPNIEVIVTDDASTDGSIGVLKAIAASDSRVKVTANERNIGAVANCNQGIARASGEFIGLLCADNLMLPGHLLAAVEYYRSHPECALRSTGWLEIFGDADRPSGIRRLPSWRNIASYSARRKLEDIFCFGDETLIETMLFPKETLERVGTFDDDAFSAVNDVELQMRYADAGLTVAYDATPYIAFRYHEASRGTPSSYVASGRQVLGWAALHERFLNSENATRLVGRRRRVAHTFAMFQKALERENPVLHARVKGEANGPVAQAERRIESIPDKLPPSRVVGPRVSVVLPTVGRVGLLVRSLESIAAQRVSDVEIVIVQDGGSNLEPFVRSLPYRDRIVFARTLVSGNAAAARNVGVRLALGETIAYLNEGDVWLPDHVSHICGALEDLAVDAVVTGARAVFYDIAAVGGSRVDPAFAPVWADNAFFAPAGGEIIDGFGLHVPLSAVAHRKYCAEVIGEFDETLLLREDWEFLLRLFGSGAFRAVQSSALTVDVAYRKHLYAHTLGERTHLLAPSLQYVFQKHPSDQAAVVAQRARQVEALAAVAAQARGAGRIEEFASLMRGIAGPAVVPEQAAVK